MNKTTFDARLLCLFLIITINCALIAAAPVASVKPTNQPTANTAGTPATPRTLIVFFSRVGSSKSFQGIDAVSSASLPQGNTIVVANMIHDIAGGDLFQIVTVDPYPAKYRDTTDVALEEQRRNARPKLATHVNDISKYDVIFIGYPNWWSTLPMPVFSFLEEYNLAGKTIIPFCTHEGSGLGASERDIARLSPKAKLLTGLAIRGSSANDSKKEVQEWLSKLGYGQQKK